MPPWPWPCAGCSPKMPADLNNGEFNRGSFFKGRVVVWQKKRGYRFALDAPLLASFIEGGREPAVEFGCGCGIISLLLLYSDKFKRIRAFEIQEDLYRLARFNAQENGFQDRFEVEHADFRREAAKLNGVQNLFGNPPFFAQDRGLVSRNPEVRAAKFETFLGLTELLAAAAAVLGADGRLNLIYPADRFDELEVEAEKCGLYWVCRRAVKSFPAGKTERFLVKLQKSSAGRIDLDPLHIFCRKGVYSPEMKEVLTGKDDAG